MEWFKEASGDVVICQALSRTFYDVGDEGCVLIISVVRRARKLERPTSSNTKAHSVGVSRQ